MNIQERESQDQQDTIKNLRESLRTKRDIIGKLREQLSAVQELVLKRDAEIAQLTFKLAGIDKQLFAEAIPKSYEPDRTLVIEQLQQQLADEREKLKGWKVMFHDDSVQLREQLAAERKGVLEAARALSAALKELASERERSKELSEDCEHYSETIDELSEQLAAVIKEGKMSNDWTLEGCCIRVQDGAVICVSDRTTADKLRQYHHAAIAALARVNELGKVVSRGRSLPDDGRTAEAEYKQGDGTGVGKP